ncbi:MAG: hypothetical protein IT459_04820 [Planctomycetes bacterium]|nr:hypothetical protein [Planctomycetota bacterium]
MAADLVARTLCSRVRHRGDPMTTIQRHPRSLLVGLGAGSLFLASVIGACRSAEPKSTKQATEVASPSSVPEVTASQPRPLARAGVIRVVLTPDAPDASAEIRVGSEAFASIADLEAALLREHDAAKLVHGTVAVILAANREVSWNFVMQVVNACKRVGITSVDFELS